MDGENLCLLLECDGMFAFLGALAKQLRKATVILVLPLRLSAWKTATTTGRILVKFHVLEFL
jgi:hypothetical protein